ncbi:MAG: hypothetical protein PHR16_08385 [Methylovulum sp.]|nr:hypothetical protein [Methylovulum sp.]
MNEAIPDLGLMSPAQRSAWFKAKEKAGDIEIMRLAAKKYLFKVRRLIHEKRTAQHD